MFNIDLLIIILASVQPLIIGLIVTLSINNLFYNSKFYKYYNNIRSKTTTTKLYECSTYSRLNNNFTYSIQTASMCLAYLIYDVDVIFFFSESTHLSNYNINEFWVLIILILFFILGIFFDYNKLTFNWKF